MKSNMAVKTNKDWEAEGDAHTMMEHAKIMADPKRKEAAMKAMEKMKKEKETECKCMEDLMEKDDGY